MRLKAKVDLTYGGRDLQPGAIFDALERDGLEMISRDEAEPFNLEDPATRPAEGLIPEASAPPDEPPAHSTPPPAAPTGETIGRTPEWRENLGNLKTPPAKHR